MCRKYKKRFLQSKDFFKQRTFVCKDKSCEFKCLWTRVKLILLRDFSACNTWVNIDLFASNFYQWGLLRRLSLYMQTDQLWQVESYSCKFWKLKLYENKSFLSFFLSFLSSHSLVKSEPIKSKPARVLHTLKSLHRLVFLGFAFFPVKFLPFSEDLSVWAILITVGLNIGSLDNTRVAVGWGGEFLVEWRVCDTRFLLDHWS